MKTTLAIASAVIALALPPPPASAQVLPPHEIAASVWSMGLRPTSSPVRQGRRYILRAVDRRGSEFTVSADAVSGRVLFVEPVDGSRPGYAQRPPRDPDQAVLPRSRAGQAGFPNQPGDPGEPPVIYAPREGANAPSVNPNYRPPSAAKPPSRVAVKPPVKPAPTHPTAASEASVPAEPPAAATDGNSPAAPATAEKNPGLAAPPVQAFD